MLKGEPKLAQVPAQELNGAESRRAGHGGYPDS